jgi:hypothetical protein
MQYAVMIDVDGEWMYVNGEAVFSNHPEPKIFYTIEEAEAERDKWNTAIVTIYKDGPIRSMTKEEREAALERERKNSVHS